jgi:hypothetical protein
MNANNIISFDELFSNEKLIQVVTGQNGNTIEAARSKVIRSLEESKALFLDKNHTYIKNGKAQRPVPCFAKRSDGNYVVKVLFSRVTLNMNEGVNAITCSKDRVLDVHDKMIQYVQQGSMDQEIKAAQERYRQSQMRNQLGE